MCVTGGRRAQDDDTIANSSRDFDAIGSPSSDLKRSRREFYSSHLGGCRAFGLPEDFDARRGAVDTSL
jgi:hypothetical protein